MNANGTCEEGWKKCLDLCVDYGTDKSSSKLDSEIYECPITDIAILDKGDVKTHPDGSPYENYPYSSKHHIAVSRKAPGLPLNNFKITEGRPCMNPYFSPSTDPYEDNSKFQLNEEGYTRESVDIGDKSIFKN